MKFWLVPPGLDNQIKGYGHCGSSWRQAKTKSAMEELVMLVSEKPELEIKALATYA